MPAYDQAELIFKIQKNRKNSCRTIHTVLGHTISGNLHDINNNEDNPQVSLIAELQCITNVGSLKHPIYFVILIQASLNS